MKIILAILIVLLLLACLYGVYVLIRSAFENKMLTSTSYEICDDGIPKPFDGESFVVVADLHNACFGKNNEKLLALIDEQQPDFIIVAGDILLGKPDAPLDTAIHFINCLAERYQVYYGYGNHEYRLEAYSETYGNMFQRYQQALNSSVIWLNNETVTIRKDNEKILLTGLNMDSYYYQRFYQRSMNSDYLKSTIGEKDTNAYQILIAHNPDYFNNYADWGANLILSGHVHGGLVRVPGIGGLLSPMVRFFPKYDKGRFEKNQSVMLLSGGLGNHTFKFRVHNIPEILSVTLRSGQ